MRVLAGRARWSGGNAIAFDMFYDIIKRENRTYTGGYSVPALHCQQKHLNLFRQRDNKRKDKILSCAYYMHIIKESNLPARKSYLIHGQFNGKNTSYVSLFTASSGT